MTPYALLRYICRNVKHWVLDAAHPTPTDLRVFAGTPGTVERVVVREILTHVDISGLQQCCDDEDTMLPTLWTESGTRGVTGCMAVSRYLGRLWRLYPVNPENALLVDSVLEMLHNFLSDLSHAEHDDGGEKLEDVVVAHLDMMECHLCNLLQDTYEEDGAEEEKEGAMPYTPVPSLTGLNDVTVADIAWAGCLDWVQHALERHGRTFECPTTLAEWRRQYARTYQYGEEDSIEDGEEEDGGDAASDATEVLKQD